MKKMKKMLKMFTCISFVVLFLMLSTTTVLAAEKTLLLGDADCDGKVAVKDATLIQKYIAGIKTLSKDGFLAGDVDNNGSTNVKDATAIQKFIAGYPTKYPVGKPINQKENDVVDEYAPIDRDTTDAVTKDMLWEIEKEFYRLVNEERKHVGVAPLTYNKHLDDIAQARSVEITQLYSHTRPDGTNFDTIIDLEKYKYSIAGENICYFYHLEGTFSIDEITFTGSDEQIKNAANIVFNAFKNSPGHYANMIHKDFENAGIGISYVWENELNIPKFYLSHNFGTIMK